MSKARIRCFWREEKRKTLSSKKNYMQSRQELLLLPLCIRNAGVWEDYKVLEVSVLG